MGASGAYAPRCRFTGAMVRRARCSEPRSAADLQGMNKRRARIALAVASAGATLVAVMDRVVARAGPIVDPAEAPDAPVAIVPGAGVHRNGELSAVLEDRMDVAIELYRRGKVRKLLVSGDHGTRSYDEPGAMARRAVSAGVPACDVFLDHAGFDTHATMSRARAVFGVERALVVSQDFHLPRALFYARSAGIDAVGVRADRRVYEKRVLYALREVPARVKALLMVELGLAPRFLGPAIPISGDGRITADRVNAEPQRNAVPFSPSERRAR